MGLFSDAARAWDELCKITYFIDLGYKRKQFAIDLVFKLDDFPHLAGMQYAKDVDFGMRRAEYYGSSLVPALLCGKLDESRIYTARAWTRIEGRLKAIINLERTLSGRFDIAKFNPKKVKGSCNIDAEYVIRNSVSGETFFVFLDARENRYYCKSAFQIEHTDYMRFQTSMTVLRVIKRSEGGSEILYRHPNFKTSKATEAPDKAIP